MSEPAAPISDIAALFAADPLSLTRETRAPMIARFRANRLKYIAGEKQAKLPKEKAAKGPKGPVPDISIDDLDL